MPGPLKFAGIFLWLMAVSSAAHGDEENANFAKRFNYRDEVARTQLAIGIEIPEIQSSTGSISGAGIHLGGDFDLSHGFSLNPNLALASNTNGVYLYTGVSSYLRYSFSGVFASSHESVFEDGVKILDEVHPSGHRLTGGIGLEQLFLNGTNNIYSIAGLSGEVSYSFALFKNQFEAMLRFTEFNSSQKNVQGIFINLSMLIGL